MANTLTEVGPDLMAYDKGVLIDEIPGLMGTTSLFNQYSVFTLSRVSGNSNIETYENDMHFDGRITEKTYDVGNQLAHYDSAIGYIGPSEYNSATGVVSTVTDDMRFSTKRSQTPTAFNIIEHAKDEAGLHLTGPMPYSWSDFLYCKYYGMIPNNNLITLRRYPLPIHDNAKTPNNDPLPPIAQAVTWLGEVTENKLSEIMNFSFGLIWKEIEAEVQTLEGVERGFGAGLEGLLGEKAAGKAGSVLSMIRGKGAQGRWSGAAQKEQDWIRGAWDNNGPYWNQVYGPVNVVHKSHMRDRGMKFDHTMNIKFHYSLKSINNINPKVAMLDIITNFLSLTYNNAKFWGGANRYFPNYKDSVLFFGDQDKFYGGDWDGYFDSIGSQLKEMSNGFLEGIEKLFTGGLSAWKDMFGGLKDSLGDMTMGKMARQSRPHILSIRSLLSGEPIGEWHLTIGNPMNPMFTIGNLIIDDVKVQFGDIIGADDFPTELIFTVQLKHGRPRDKGDIESMFNYGHGRMAYSPLTRLPSEGNTFADANIDPSAADQISGDNLSSGTLNVQNKENAENTILNQGVEQRITSQDTYDRVTGRMRRQWGPAMADSPNLLWILNQVKGKF